MRYKTPAALEMAVKEAAKKSPLDTNRAISRFYFHQFLCRVFRDPDSPFVLKGGQSMLARTVDARATRDIDLLARETSVEAAVAELRRLWHKPRQFRNLLVRQGGDHQGRRRVPQQG